MKHSFSATLLIGSLLLVSVACCATARAGDDVKLPPQMYGGAVRDFFAIQEKTCPPGSTRYTGPEEEASLKKGVALCVFARQYTWFKKNSGMTKCPDGAAPVEAGIPDDGGIWCDNMRDAWFNLEGQYIPRQAREKILTETAEKIKEAKEHPTEAPKVLPPKGVAPPPSVIAPKAPVSVPPTAAEKGATDAGAKELPDLLKGKENVAPPGAAPSKAVAPPAEGAAAQPEQTAPATPEVGAYPTPQTATQEEPVAASVDAGKAPAAASPSLWDKIKGVFGGK